MIPVTSKDLIPFTPESAQEEEPKPVYYLKTPNVAEKALFRRELMAQGAHPVSDERVYHELRKKIPEFITGDDVPAVLACIDEVQALKPGEKLGEDSQKLLEVVEGMVIERDPEYARLIAARSYFFSMIQITGVSMFCVKWDNLPTPCERKGGRLTEESLEAIPQRHLLEIGNEVFRRMSVGREERKN